MAGRDIEVATELGKITAALESIGDRLTKVEGKLDNVVGVVNRWKGATGILVVLGGLFGWVANLFLKTNGKA